MHRFYYIKLIFFVCFVLQCVAIVDPLTLNHMDVSSKPEKIKMDALCELTAKIQQNPHPGNRACFYMLHVGLMSLVTPVGQKPFSFC